MVKVSIHRKSQNFAPESDLREYDFSSIGSAIEATYILLKSKGEDFDLRVSKSGQNSNVVGLGVDYDIEIQDIEYDENNQRVTQLEGEEI